MRNTLAWIGLAIILILAVQKYVLPPTAHSVRESGIVTLRASAGNSTVQMFDALRDDANALPLRDGLRCTKVSDLLRYGNGDTAMFFYKLNCSGRTGYVNADWVR